MVRPFSLALRLFVAMIAGHILVEGVRQLRRQRAQRRRRRWARRSACSRFVFIVGVSALELLVCAIQAYVFALLTSLYINDAVNLH